MKPTGVIGTLGLLEAFVRRFETLVIAAVGVVLVGATPALAHGGGGWHGGYGGGWHGGYGWHGGWGGSVYLGLGPWWGYPYPYYAYPYSYPYPYPYPYSYSSPYPSYAAPAPAAPAASPPSVWYYCRSKKGYYPYVSSCPEAWQQVPTQPPQ
jgi:hypothetical protein